MNQEVLFASTLEKIRKQAKEQGNCIEENQVREAFEPLHLEESQMQMVFDYLVKHKVGIGTPVNPDEYLSEEERDYLQDYLKELEALKEYSEGEKQAYTLAAMAGEADACEILTQIYLKDVVDLAKLYTGQGAFLEDLIGEGNVALAIGVGMLGSLESPEEAQGMLGKMIMDAMEDYIQENTAQEKTDKKVADRVNQVADKARELAEELHRKVTVEELAQETKLTEKAILDAIRMSGYKIEDIAYAENNIQGL